MVPLDKSYHLLWFGYEAPLARFLSAAFPMCFLQRDGWLDDHCDSYNNLFFSDDNLSAYGNETLGQSQ